MLILVKSADSFPLRVQPRTVPVRTTKRKGLDELVADSSHGGLMKEIEAVNQINYLLI